MVAAVTIPDEFICPITMEIMVNPLATRYGHNFEREAIIAWLRRGNDCPVTRKPLRVSSTFHNNQLATKIHLWREQNGVSCSAKAMLRDEDNKPEDDSSATNTLSHIYGTASLPFKSFKASSRRDNATTNAVQSSRVLSPFRLRRLQGRNGRQRS